MMYSCHVQAKDTQKTNDALKEDIKKHRTEAQDAVKKAFPEE
jgi:hypothetical protein